MARSKKRARDESSLSDEERVRRDRQRELQRAAIAAHASGEEFVNAEKKKRKPLAARRLAERKERRRVEHAAAKRAVQKEVKKQKAAAPDVVIVPIFWKGEAKQMARVLSACADVEAALADSGRRVMLDGGHKYTPGQKFAHWEHKGVKLRIEIGPREAERGCCTRSLALARSRARLNRVSRRRAHSACPLASSRSRSRSTASRRSRSRRRATNRLARWRTTAALLRCRTRH